ncbi:hypothetical protein [Phycicoccus sp. 3266]|uniref:hypothetical protein n=1 Tax=Phycicoccus sp. 3266 TaxID=2817751 RepID=UPI00285C5A70|nr:hypothetical protein [Phycicoccus sp. 3266]MDR6864139.1 hypothetical protein [Phycicoccus sp. 3266]
MAVAAGGALVLLSPTLRSHGVPFSTPSDAPPRAAGALSQGFGSYAAAIHAPDGTIDVEQTVRRLSAVGANHYYYLIWDRRHPGESQPSKDISSTEWTQLPAFAERAAKAGISITVYLVPPSESSSTTYRPFGWDYQKWFSAVGQVAQAHPNIKAIALDDFASNTVLRIHDANHQPFRPDDVTGMVRAARSHAPWLRFYAVMYSQDLVSPTAVLPAYRNVIDGVILAFAGPKQYLHAVQNTTDSSGALREARRARQLTQCQSSAECLQVAFPDARFRMRLPQAVSLERSVRIERGTTSVLRFSALDDRSSPSVASYSLSVTIDGHQAPVQRTQGADGWTNYTAQVVAQSSGSAKLRLTVDARVGSRGFGLSLDDVEFRAGSTSATLQPNGWDVSASGGGRASLVRKLDLVFLVYCAPFGREAGIAGAADSQYVASVLDQVRPLIDEGAIDGVVAYRLNLLGKSVNGYGGGDPASFAVVQRYFRGLRNAG